MPEGRLRNVINQPREEKLRGRGKHVCGEKKMPVGWKATVINEEAEDFDFW